jgi:hypothetical protein
MDVVKTRVYSDNEIRDDGLSNCWLEFDAPILDDIAYGKLVRAYADWYFDTEQDISEFAEEYYNFVTMLARPCTTILLNPMHLALSDAEVDVVVDIFMECVCEKICQVTDLIFIP